MRDVLPRDRVLVCVTGASGSAYAEVLIRTLLGTGIRTYVIFTETARKVVHTELGDDGLLAALGGATRTARFEDDPAVVAAARASGLEASALGHLRTFANDDLYAPVASGSEGCTHMVVCPSSMGTLARIAHGVSGCLVERAADVMLKERRTLIVVPRETPFSSIHLQNMLQLAQAGAHIVPAMPGFYQRPKTVEDVVWFVVERVLDQLRIEGLRDLKRIQWNVRRL